MRHPLAAGPRFLRAPARLGLLASVVVATAAFSDARAEVVITEIHYDPPQPTDRHEFVEILNTGPEPVDLSGWSFTRGIDWTFPPGVTAAPGEYVVVAEDPRAFRQRFEGVDAHGPFSGRLDSDGETVVLRAADGTKVDEVDYDRGYPWPVAGGSTGWSIEKLRPDLDGRRGGHWRSSTPASDTSRTFVEAGAMWSYRKGTQEASSPRDAWRQREFDAGSWPTGRTPVGYGESIVRTELADMPDGYTGVFCRRTFEVEDPAAVGALLLEVVFDDGFAAWINGTSVASANLPTDDPAYDATANSAIEDLSFRGFQLADPGEYLVAGENVLALQVHNASIGGSSDAFIDARLSVASGAGEGPTPGARNSVRTENPPPRAGRVRHRPEMPAPGTGVLVTVEADDPAGLEEVVLEVQTVDPGRYIAIDDPEYTEDWTPHPMRDDGQGGDAVASDGTWSVVLPASLQEHRRLVRYRALVRGSGGREVRVPYPDDPQPNFAYFCYGDVPSWRGAVRPGSPDPDESRVVEVSSSAMTAVQVVHLITKRESTDDCTWFSRYRGSDYLWRGTVVHDGDVYDHVRFRARGGVWRYAMGKNMWKFNFWRAHRFRARDPWRDRYRTRWDKLNLSAIIQQGDYLHRGEQGLFEGVGFRLFELAGVEACKSFYVHFRIIDEEEETGPTQYDGDFWGLYLALEQMDGRFLDEHRLPDGNFYKMEGGTGEANNIGPAGPDDRSDLDAFLSTYRNTTPSNAWWRANLDLPRYYSYRSIVEAIHHYDIGGGKNYFYYLNPEEGHWQVHPWDLDLTWANNMFGDGDEPFRSRVLSRPAFALEYRNRMREIRDLLFNEDETGRLIEEFAGMVDDPFGTPSIVDADRMRWDWHPVMADSSLVNLSKAGQGRYYRIAEPETFEGMVELMKDWVRTRSAWIDRNITRDSAIPERPVVSFTGPDGYPLDELTFRSSGFDDPQGGDTFAAIAWRAGEVARPGAAGFRPDAPRPYEIEAVWESGSIAEERLEVRVPPEALGVGRRYRVRARMQDSSGRWSHWSEPVEFTVTEPSEVFPQVRALRVTEMLYHPPPGTDLEFIEIANVGPEPVDLGPVSFADGIEFAFAGGEVQELAPGQRVVVVENREAFESVWDPAAEGILVAGEYDRSLANDGEALRLVHGVNVVIQSFVYDDGWYPRTDGQGFSLVAVDPLADPSAWNDPRGWRESSELLGTPGRTDGPPPAGGLRRTGDANADGLVDVSDAISLLLILFEGPGRSLPCDGDSAGEGGNAAVLDANGDAAVDITDAVHIASWLFRDGAPPAEGTRCRRIEGCESACGF